MGHKKLFSYLIIIFQHFRENINHLKFGNYCEPLYSLEGVSYLMTSKAQ